MMASQSFIYQKAVHITIHYKNTQLINIHPQIMNFPANKAESIRKWLKENVLNFLTADGWPVYSPKNNSLNY